jgi:hypothetical protein
LVLIWTASGLFVTPLEAESVFARQLEPRTCPAYGFLLFAIAKKSVLGPGKV